jgi:diguanylate cyclase (GGDEF)-like protein
MMLILLLTALCALPQAARAVSGEKTVRVGWYESSYNSMDETGRRSGYAYEYQMKLAAYTGWSFEYVTGSWSDLLQMLIDGEIDLMSDVSYTPERAEKMLYPSLPMGTEEYYVFTSPNHPDIIPGDYATLNGKRIGVNKDSVQADYYREWAAANGVHAELIEVTYPEDESLRRMEIGELDAYVTVDSFTDPKRALPVCKVGASDFFFAVSKDRPDLLIELNAAMSKLQDENRYYNQQMYAKYIVQAGANAFLSTNELDWLASHGPIRVGYQNNYLAFCAADEDGQLTGMLKDFLDHAGDSMANAHLDFEPVVYPSSGSALAALERGEVDCVFPINFRAYDGEKRGIAITTPLMDTDIYAVVRMADQQVFGQQQHVIVAVNAGNPNYDSFLQDNFPEWRKVYFANTNECLEAVSQGMADCVLISSYRYNNIARTCEKYRLTTLSTGVGLDYCFAVDRGETELYSILTKAIGLVPSSTVNAALSYYITEDAKLSFTEVLADNLWIVLGVAAVILLVILFLLLRSIRSERKAQRLIAATETDALTGLYSRNYFFEYANNMFREHPETPMDAIVLNIEQFHSVNALKGRDYGDGILRALGREVQLIAGENGGIAGRFGADRFDVYCRHLEDYPALFNRLQSRLDDLSENTGVRIRMGVMPWQEQLEPVQMFDRARTACNMARGHYKEHLIVFDESVHERELREQRMLSDLRHALDAYEFEAYYQPIYDVSSEPPKLVSAEALVRWQHPELGLIPPDDFIPLLERSGLIGEVDRFVWSQTARQIARWRAQFNVTVPTSVNLSRIDILDPKLADTLDRILAENGLEHDALRLEVTESAYTENADQVIRVVEVLRARGYTVEMDDFGTGYSSLNMLSAMPIDVLKMDRTFIRNIGSNERDEQLVALILGIAKSLNVPVIAEGVETQTQLNILRDLGCTLVQGFYFSRPLHPADFEDEIFRNA